MSIDVFVDELIERAKARGLTITIDDDGQCFITGKRDKATDTLLNALKEWKPAIVKRLRPDALDRVLAEARRIEQEMMDARRNPPKETPATAEPDVIDCEAVFAEAAKEREFIDFANRWNAEKRREHNDKR